jgi:hypothetical protein
MYVNDAYTDMFENDRTFYKLMHVKKIIFVWEKICRKTVYECCMRLKHRNYYTLFSGKFGVAEPWYFIFNPAMWCGQGSSKEGRYNAQNEGRPHIFTSINDFIIILYLMQNLPHSKLMFSKELFCFCKKPFD